LFYVAEKLCAKKCILVYQKRSISSKIKEKNFLEEKLFLAIYP
jgi:hypothetical protein